MTALPFVKRTAAACAIALVALATPAAADSVWYENYTTDYEAAIAEVVAAALTTETLEPMSRDILAGLLVSDPGTTHYSVLEIQFPDETGEDKITLIIGEDDLTDDDDGWGAVWSLDINLEPRDQLSPYVITSSTLNLAAG